MFRGRHIRLLAALMTLICLGNPRPALAGAALKTAAAPLAPPARARQENAAAGAAYSFGLKRYLPIGAGFAALLSLGAAGFALAKCHHLRQKNLALQKTNDMQTDFLARISHEIRTPLGAIIGMNHLVAERAEDPAAVRDCAQKIELSADHLLSLLNDLLDLAKINEGGLTLTDRPFDLRNMLSTLDQLCRLSAKEAGLTLEFHLDPRLGPFVRGDELRLKQVLINLLSNAVKYNRRGGRVALTVLRAAPQNGPQRVYFCVEDTGIGVEPEFARRIFDGYARERRGSADGTGLGLNISKRLVGMMGGELRLESEVGRGSRFFFTLPLPAATELPRSPEFGAPALDLEGKTVLIAEDNPVNLYVIGTMVSSLGARVRKAENGRQAVEQYLASGEGELFAILLDIRMPEMDGCEAARRIRGAGRADSAAVPILALSANAFDDEVRRSLDAGMNAHLIKPLDAAALQRALLPYANQAQR